MKEEQVILVDRNDRPIGLMSKLEAHKKALLHRAFSVFIFNRNGDLLLQQRAAEKYHSPGLWTNTVCSHQRNGEGNIGAGERRLMEEMGIEADLREIFHFIYKTSFDNGLTEHELDHVMIGFSDTTPKINPKEVMGFRWKKLEDIREDMANHPEQYTEWFKIIFAHSFDKLKSELETKMLAFPLSFESIFKETVWGGNKLKDVLNKNIFSNKTGESWDISAVGNDISVVKNGYFKGKNLQELSESFREKLLGKRVYQKFGNKFPLLIKYIDANANLSIQVHPDDEMAEKYHHSFGKNELWYVIQADSDGILYIGFKKGITRKEYLHKLEQGNLEDILNKIEVKSGDTFYIPAGTVHAIGKGVLLAEIQQTSDLTYRIYDWNRTGLDGKPRELHTKKALEAIDFKAGYRNRTENYIKTPYFQILKQNLSESQSIDISNIDSFIILMNTGNGSFIIDDVPFEKGDTLLLPAIKNTFSIKLIKQGKFLQIYI